MVIKLILFFRTKKIVSRLECSGCKILSQISIKWCKHFEIDDEKQRKGRIIQFLT
uniref:Uncharacterized protein n=1 Tax=Tetranychus urticae TaxID=32264 RepID=T1K575_TETUR